MDARTSADGGGGGAGGGGAGAASALLGSRAVAHVSSTIRGAGAAALSANTGRFLKNLLCFLDLPPALCRGVNACQQQLRS
jgi:hypothetical protein